MTCEKVRYENYKEVNDAIHAIGRNRRRNLKSYKCSECGGFHIASEGKKKAIWNIKEQSVNAKVKNWNQNPIPKIKKKVEPVFATEKMISKEQAKILKRLVEGSNGMI